MFPFAWRKFIAILTLSCSVWAGFHAPDVACAQESAWQAADWVLNPQQALAYRRQDFLNDRKAQGASAPGAQQSEALRRVVRYYLSQLTHGETAKLPKDVRLLDNEILSQFTTPAARVVMMEEVLARAPDLLTHPDPIVRTNITLILIQLSTEPQQTRAGGVIPAVPYIPSHRILIDVLNEPSQVGEVRILAARGLGRIVRDGLNVASGVKSAVAEALVDALSQLPINKSDENWWFRYRLVEALGYVDRLDNTTQSPIVIDTLLQVLANREERWITRSQAALSLSRLPFGGTTNVPLVAHEIAGLLAEMAQEYQKSPNNPVWRHAFSRVYLSFKPQTEAQAREKRWGLLHQIQRPGVGGHAGYVQRAFEASFVVMKPVVGNGPNQPPATIPPDALEALETWLAENAPDNRRPTPRSEPLAVANPDAAPPQ